jgi:hypothetical protein
MAVLRGAYLAQSCRHPLAGARYSFLDRTAPHGKLTYRLQAVAADGSRIWYGRASVTH